MTAILTVTICTIKSEKFKLLLRIMVEMRVMKNENTILIIKKVKISALAEKAVTYLGILL